MYAIVAGIARLAAVRNPIWHFENDEELATIAEPVTKIISRIGRRFAIVPTATRTAGEPFLLGGGVWSYFQRRMGPAQPIRAEVPASTEHVAQQVDAGAPAPSTNGRSETPKEQLRLLHRSRNPLMHGNA